MKTIDQKIQLATPMSWYNGEGGLAFPINDTKTTGDDYANDVLVCARGYAENWDWEKLR